MLTYYTIQMASKMSGVGVHTIRAWEKRYKAIVPSRDEAGHRVYSKDDVEKLMLLSELCLIGYTISKIASLTIPDLKLQLKELGKKDASTLKLIPSEDEVNLEEILVILKLALKTYKLDVISQELSKLKNLISPKDFVFKVASPLMRDLGFAVEAKEYSVAQEHALSSILRNHIGYLLYKNTEGFKHRPQYLVAGIEGDWHEFGILQAALLCHEYQINALYFGANLPVDALIETIKSLHFDGVIIGATSMMGEHKKSQLEAYLDKLVPHLNNKTDLIFGSGIEVDIKKLKGAKKFYQFKSLMALAEHLETI